MNLSESDKLGESEVREIREACSPRVVSFCKLGLSESAIRAIVARRAWKHVA